jgi:hypothetical protein
MADQNPMGRPCAIALAISRAHCDFVQAEFEGARDDLLDDLAAFPDPASELELAREKVATYERLLTSLGTGVLVPDNGVRAVIEELAEAIDDDHGSQSRCEHEAIHALLDQLPAPEGGS